jgi:hypothetical protein
MKDNSTDLDVQGKIILKHCRKIGCIHDSAGGPVKAQNFLIR